MRGTGARRLANSPARDSHYVRVLSGLALGGGMSTEKLTTKASEKEAHMITEVVTFKLPTGMTRDQLISNYRQTAPKWRENPDLIRKNYLYDGTNGLGGGVYLWKDLAAAKKWHDDRWRQGVIGRYSSEPIITYFETAIVVDNLAQSTIEDTTRVA
jgi:hypothetical protein